MRFWVEMRRSRRRLWRTIGPLLPLVWLCGCSTFVSSRAQKEDLVAAYQAGNYAAAAAIATERATAREDTGDELMWRLEEGSVKFAAGDADGSLAAFERAEALIADHEQRAVVNLREGAAESTAVLLNPNVLPYTGNYADKIMLNTLKAMAYLARGELTGAGVELRRADERQREAKTRYEAEIAAAEQQAREHRISAPELIAGSPELQSVNTDLDRAAGTVFGEYVNPLTTYLSAFNYLWQNNPGEALVDFQNLLKMQPDHPTLRRDCVSCLAALGSSPPPEQAGVKPWPYPLHDRICLVVVENGLAPARRQQTIHLPLPPPVGYTGIAIPVPEYFPRNATPITIRNPSARKRIAPTPIADLDGIFARAYRMELPLIITRLAVATTVKEGANIAAMYAVREQHPAVQIGTLVGTSLYRLATNRADLRSWQCLPGEYRVGHLPLPADGRLEVNGCEVRLPPTTRRAVLWIRILPTSPPLIRVFPVKE